jgi:hypothetical protein
MKVHNLEVIKVALNGFTEATIKPQIAKILGEIADEAIDYIQGSFAPPSGDDEFPIYTGNMRDATGVGVYYDSMLYAYRPPKIATGVQDMTNNGGHSGIINIDGSTNLEKALNAGITKYSVGLWIVLFSAVPYAELVNELGSPRGRGASYFNKLESWLLERVRSRIQSPFPVGFSYE